MDDTSFILRSDAYKYSHWRQYPKGTTNITAYLESRGGKFPHTLFFGLQAILKKYFGGVRVTSEDVAEAAVFCEKVFADASYFNRAGWQRIVDVHGGHLPIRIRAVREGSVTPVSNVLMTVENTDPALPWITNFCETLLMQVWYPITVATQSFEIKRLISRYAEKCGCETSSFHLNDFGFRGVSSVESAGLGGAAHLVNFLGTDTMEGIRYAMAYYGADVCGFSVAAAEHSTVTIYGQENEAKAYERFLEEFPTGIISIVSDSYDLFNAVENIFGKELKEKILARDGGLVVRPDSGDPAEMSAKTLELLWDAFGGTTNEAGYRTLNPKLSVIYGDGINFDSIDRILAKVVTEHKFTTDNIVFGMGGALLQQVNRDTQKFAFKCCSAIVDGERRDVFKLPKTDSGKASKRGLLELYRKDNGAFVTGLETDLLGDPQLETVFENGQIIRDQTFKDVRDRSNEFARSVELVTI